MPRVVEESWQISSVDTTNITYANGVDSKWSDMWKYQVPTGEAIILRPSHHFSIYLDETSGNDEVEGGKARVKIEVRDQSEQDAKGIFGPKLYDSCKDFDDVTKMATLELQSDISIEEKFWIVVMVYNTSGTTTKYDYSYFELEAVRVRSGM